MSISHKEAIACISAGIIFPLRQRVTRPSDEKFRIFFEKRYRIRRKIIRIISQSVVNALLRNYELFSCKNVDNVEEFTTNIILRDLLNDETILNDAKWIIENVGRCGVLEHVITTYENTIVSPDTIRRSRGFKTLVELLIEECSTLYGAIRELTLSFIAKLYHTYTLEYEVRCEQNIEDEFIKRCTVELWKVELTYISLIYTILKAVNLEDSNTLGKLLDFLKQLYNKVDKTYSSLVEKYVLTESFL